MFRNYLAAALRNLVRNRFYAALSIVGLAVGIAAAVLMGLVIRNQMTFDHFIPGHQNTYLMVSEIALKPLPVHYSRGSQNFVADMLKLQVPEIESVTRLASQDVRIEHGDISNKEKIAWADSNVFDVLPLPVVFGDLKAALEAPDSIVLTRSAARKYFGKDDPRGQVLELSWAFDKQTPQPLGRFPMRVTAVVEDLPPNGTDLESGIFASGLSAGSRLTALDEIHKLGDDNFFDSVRIYLRPKPGAAFDRFQERVAAINRSTYALSDSTLNHSSRLLRLDRVHLFQGLNPGIINRLVMDAITGALVLLAACVNFVNLVTARSVRRATEVGVRKVSGAQRRALMLQFLGEALLHVMVAAGLALLLVRLLLPEVNAFLGTGADASFWHDPLGLAVMAIGLVALAFLGGLYPAFILSGLRPAQVLKDAVAPSGSLVRRALVTVQFAVLIGFIIAASVVFQQRDYATHEALRTPTDQVLFLPSVCNQAFKNELRRLPGVRAAACVDRPDLSPTMFSNLTLAGGATIVAQRVAVDPDIFDVLQVDLLAGRILTWGVEGGRDAAAKAVVPYVINETAARRLGFPNPQAALGQVVTATFAPKGLEIVGVVQDFALTSVEQRIEPVFFFFDPGAFRTIEVRLSGQEIPETLAAMDRLWRATGATEPMQRTFMDDYIQSLYLEVLREAEVFAIYAALAVLLSCLGLIGLSAATTERRTKEIGIRKAMGARNADILRLLLWEFAKPVLWANAVAWPIGYVLMRRWLQGFAYHIELSSWLFLAASALALVIAVLTVTGHALLVARSQPVTALRYE